VAELGGLLEARRGQAAAREERLDRVDTVIEGTAGPADDPTEWKELVEEHYQVVAPQMAELEPAERIEVEDDYVRKLGHLPAPLTRFLRAGMLSGEPDQEAAAALRIAGLADHDPALVAAIPEAERARAAAIAEFAELGLKPARAVELGDEKLTIRDKFLRPDDPLAEPTPEPYRPGYVWEDGRWRPETPEEAQGKNMPEVAEQAADGGAGDDDGGARAKTPTDGTPKDEDAGRDGVLGDKSEEKGEDEKAEPQSEDPSASSANDENLNRIERSLHNKAELARKLGLDFAADSLERFLDGSGIAMNLERDKARRFDALRGAEATNQQRVVERGFLGKQATPHKHNVTLKKMKDGETIKLAKDHWDRDFTTQGLAIGGELNFALATGHSKFKTEGEYRATRKGDVIYIEGTATHAWKDRYDFHGKDDLGGDAKRLQDAGRGKPFDIKSEWRQHLKGTIRIENGNLSDPKFQWTDAK
jgi:hypothetical protein